MKSIMNQNQEITCCGIQPRLDRRLLTRQCFVGVVQWLSKRDIVFVLKQLLLLWGPVIDSGVYSLNYFCLTEGWPANYARPYDSRCTSLYRVFFLSSFTVKIWFARCVRRVCTMSNDLLRKKKFLSWKDCELIKQFHGHCPFCYQSRVLCTDHCSALRYTFKVGLPYLKIT